MMNVKMIFYFMLFIAVIATIKAKDNIKEIDSSSKCSPKGNFCCNFTNDHENWIYWDITKDTCITDDYLTGEQPEKDSFIPLLAVDFGTTALRINEKEKTLEVDIKMELIWEDTRIRSYSTDEQDLRRLPLIRKNTPSYMWIPPFEIKRVKELKYLHDPIMYNYVELVPSMMIKKDKQNTYPINSTLTRVFIEWHVTVSCNFDYLRYPSDNQSCPIEMYIWYANVTLHDRNSLVDTNSIYKGTERIVEMQGFTITKDLVYASYGDESNYGRYSKFGYNFRMERHVEPYILQYYIPCFGIVLVSFFSFVVPISATPGRIGLIVTQFLTLTNLFIHQRVCIS